MKLSDRPGFRNGTYLVHDPVRNEPALLYPEGVLVLSETAAAVLRSCDGRTSVLDLAAQLAEEYDGVVAEDVLELLDDVAVRGLVVPGGGPAPARPCGTGSGPVPRPDRAPTPVGLIAELTYRCPLRCTYCSNPVELASYRDELSTEEWARVLGDARALGVLQAHFSGGEPLLRPDLPVLIAHARRHGLYPNLVTSGIPLDAARMAALVDAGLDHLQLSVQDADAGGADAIAGVRAHDRKHAAAALVREAGLPLTVNVVLHAANLDRITAITDLAASLGAARLELAHTQFYGWALRNRDALMPSASQVAAAADAVAEARSRYGAALEIVYVQPDHFGDRPKPCSNGWGRQQLAVAPNGDVLPCLAAASIPHLGIENVRNATLAGAWYGSAAFTRFRGTDWMREPCRSCALREIDFGGCRCQAFAVTGNPAATDPACGLSPAHGDFRALALTAAARPAAAHRSNR